MASDWNQAEFVVVVAAVVVNFASPIHKVLINFALNSVFLLEVLWLIVCHISLFFHHTIRLEIAPFIFVFLDCTMLKTRRGEKNYTNYWLINRNATENNRKKHREKVKLTC